MDKHPPIPPNCDLFYEPNAAKGPYWIINNLAETSICLVDTDADDRMVIAAVAEVAWRIEVDRLDIALGDICDPANNPSVELADEYDAAIQNAYEWREWGRK